jgi:hypothetical protein
MEAEPEVRMRGGGAIGDWYVLLLFLSAQIVLT